MSSDQLSEELQLRIQKGATLLDEKKPGWAKEIDLKLLDIDNYFECPLGQLYGTFALGAEALWPETLSTEEEIETIAHGFFMADENDETLGRKATLYWKEIVAKRLG